MFQKYAFYFDLDGTLVDSQLDFSRLRRLLQLKEGTDILQHVLGLEGDSHHEAMSVIDDFELEGLEASSLFPGAREFVSEVAALGMNVGILTRNSRKVAMACIERFDLAIELVVAREDVNQVKPHPEGLLKMALAHGVEPSMAVYMGNYQDDVLAAANAGMKSIFFNPDGSSTKYAADIEIDSFISLSRRLPDHLERLFTSL